MRTVFLATALLIFVQLCGAGDVCRVDERLGIGLVRLEESAKLLKAEYGTKAAEDCYSLCCNYTDNACNAVSFHQESQDFICVLLSCLPFKSCVWMTAPGFTAARVQLAPTPPTDNAQPISDQSSSMTSSPMTSQQPIVVTSSSAQLDTSPSASNAGGSSSDGMETLNQAATTTSSTLQSFQAQTDYAATSPDWIVENSQPSVTTQQTTVVVSNGAPLEGDYFLIHNLTDESFNDTQEVNVSVQNIDSNMENPWNIEASLFSETHNSNGSQKSDDDNNDKEQTVTENKLLRTTSVESWNIDYGVVLETVNGQPDSGGNEQLADSVNNGQPLDNNGQPLDNNGQPADSNYKSQEDDTFWNLDETLTDKKFDSDSSNANSSNGFEQTDLNENDFYLEENKSQESINNDGLNAPSNPTGTDETKPQVDQSQPFYDQPSDQSQPSTDQAQPPLDQSQFSFVEESTPIGENQPSNAKVQPDFAVPVFVPEGPASTAKPRGQMKRLLIQSPGIIIGLCSALGVSFLVLVAVCRKVYQGQDRPKYKPLRDYDIRFEPPAASSALLP